MVTAPSAYCTAVPRPEQEPTFNIANPSRVSCVVALDCLRAQRATSQPFPLDLSTCSSDGGEDDGRGASSPNPATASAEPAPGCAVFAAAPRPATGRGATEGRSTAAIRAAAEQLHEARSPPPRLSSTRILGQNHAGRSQE